MSFNIQAKIRLLGPTSAELSSVANSIRNAVRNISANINVKTSTQAKSNLKGLTNQTVLAGNAVQKLTAATTAYGAASKSTTSAIRGHSAATAELTSLTEKFGYSAGLAIKRFAAFTVVATPILGAVGAFSKGVKAAIEFERELVKVAQVGGRPIATLKFLSDEITRLSTKFGTSSNELVKVSMILAQAGQNAQQVKTALEAIAEASLTPTFVDMQSAAEAAI